MLAALPSPSSAAVEVGPLTIRAYGVVIAVGVVLGVRIAQRRWEARGGDGADIASLALWAVPAGLVGARLYHVVTDWHRFDGRWWHVLAVWEGGLGIPGGLVVGVVTGAVVASRARTDRLHGRRAGGPRIGPAHRRTPSAHGRGPGGLSCRDAAQALQSFLDQEVDGGTARRMVAHLETCRRCGLEAEVYRQIKASLARSAPPVPDLTRRRLRRFGEHLGTGGRTDQPPATRGGGPPGRSGRSGS